MIRFRPSGEVATAEAIRRSDRFRSNAGVLAERWSELLADHPREWAVVFGDGRLVTAPTMRAIADAVPGDERASAVFRYIVSDDRPLLL